MRNLLSVVLFFICFSVFGQFNNGGVGRDRSVGRIPNTNQGVPKSTFDPYKIVGLVQFDVDKLNKKSKIKDKKVKKKFLASISKYNKSVNDLSRINSFTLNEIKKTFDAKREAGYESKDFSDLAKYQKVMTKQFRPISKESNKVDSILMSETKSILSKKDFKRWVKYHDKKRPTFDIPEENLDSPTGF